jgi:hypothetical protein
MNKRQEDAIQRHWKRETETFRLRSWECPPVLATGDAPSNTAWAESWPIARQRRLQLLAEDPYHYDDVDSR